MDKWIYGIVCAFIMRLTTKKYWCFQHPLKTSRTKQFSSCWVNQFVYLFRSPHDLDWEHKSTTKVGVDWRLVCMFGVKYHLEPFSLIPFEKLSGFTGSTYTWMEPAGSSCQRRGPAGAGRCTAVNCLHCSCVCDWKAPAGTGSPAAWSYAEASCDLKTHSQKYTDILMTSHTRAAASFVFTATGFHTVDSQVPCRESGLGQDLQGHPEQSASRRSVPLPLRQEGESRVFIQVRVHHRET